MHLLNTMTKMLLQSAPQQTVIQFSTALLVFMDYDPSSPSALSVHNQFTKHLMILIVYGYKHINFDLFDEEKIYGLLEFPKEAKYVCGVARVIVSILPRACYQAYRKDVRKRQQKLFRELDKDSPNKDELVRLKKTLENAHDVSTPRPLQHLCRLKVYDIKSGDKLPEIVGQLEIPEALKHMLTLGVYTKH
jgi:hypothetical protein